MQTIGPIRGASATKIEGFKEAARRLVTLG
jgi:hypothetical protein